MGMFDWYQFATPQLCRTPGCQEQLDGWQGKDGPCELLTWHQGQPAPVPCDADLCDCENDPADLERFSARRLPSPFHIYTNCDNCGQWHDAICRTDCGAWSMDEPEISVEATRVVIGGLAK